MFEKRIDNDLSLTLKVLSPFQESLQGVAVESTFNWYWLVDGLPGCDGVFILPVLRSFQPGHLDVINRVPRVQPEAAHVIQTSRARQIGCRQFAHEHCIDKPEERNWVWPY